MLDATFSAPDLDRFCLLDRLGLTVTGQHIADDHTVLACRVVEPDDSVERDCWCHHCGAQGVPRGTVVRELAHVPNGWRPTILQVRVRRYCCVGCGHVWRQDLAKAAAPRAKLTTHAVLWALRAVVIDRASIARVAAGLGCSWHTVNDAVLAAGRTLPIDDPTRLDGVKVLGVDEHCWRHPRTGQSTVQRFLTVVIDLIPVRDKTGPARLLDIVEGRSKQVFTAWLAAPRPGRSAPDRDRCHGRVHRVQDRRRRSHPEGHGAPAPATAPPKRSTAASSTSAGPHSAFATSATTSAEHCSTPAGSDRDYTLFCDEPDNLGGAARPRGAEPEET